MRNEIHSSGKILLSAFFIVALCQFTWGQASEGKIKFRKEIQPAIVMTFPYSTTIVENALNARMADKRIPGKKSRGFLVFQQADINEISSVPLDYSFKIESSGKKDAEQSTVYLVMEGASVLAGDPAVIGANAKKFLEGLVPDVERSHVVSQIKKQEEILAREEKKLKNLEEAHTNLEKKLKENEDEQEKQQKVLLSQKSIVDDLKTKQQ